MGRSLGPAGGERVLVIHPGALGDVLQAVPALRALSDTPGVAAVTLAAQPRLARLLAGLGAVEDALDFDGLGLDALFTPDGDAARATARLAPYSRVVSWFGARSDPYPARLRALVPRALLALSVPAAGAAPEAVWEHLWASLAAWAPAAPRREPLRLPAPWREAGRVALAASGLDPARPPLVVHPGAGGASKRWPTERFLRALDGPAAGACPILVHEGPADAEAAGALLAGLGARARRLHEPGLPTLAAVLAGAAAYLGGDSGVSHLAAAVGAPAVIVHSEATLPRWAPWSPTARTVVATPAGWREATALLADLLRVSY